MSSAGKGAASLAGRYARALFELAEVDEALDRVSDDLSRLDAMIDESKDLARMLRSPAVGRRDQAKAMDALLGRAGVCNLVVRFVGVVAENRRLAALPDMSASYRQLLAKHRGEAAASVVSARELTGEQRDFLNKSLKEAIGASVAIEAKVEPGLLGGLVIKVGSKMIDNSLRTKLQRMRLAMKGAE